MKRSGTWSSIGLALISLCATGCGGASAGGADDKAHATATPPATATQPPAQSAASDKVRRGWRMVDRLVAKMRETTAAVRAAKGDPAKIESLKAAFQHFAAAQRASGKELLSSMTAAEKAQLDAYAHTRARPAMREMRQAFAVARGGAPGARSHADKPPAPLQPGESRPPAHHSEHREQMRAYGGAKGCPHAARAGTKECPHAAKPGAKGHGHGHKAHSKHHRFKDAAKWAKIFESKKRDKWQRGDAVVASLKLKRDARIADIGAGTGYFSMRFARQVRSGVVYAVDIEKTMVDWVLKRARRKRLENVVGVVATANSAKLPGAVDLIFVSNTYHHISERPSYFARLQRNLRPRGRVVIVDFKMGKLPVGPPDSHKIAPDRIIAEMAKAGYKLTRRDDKLLPYQHLFVFQSR